MVSEKQWYQIENVDELDTPALVIYKNRVIKNIATLINGIDDISRLRPHVKTHKSQQVCELMLKAGIKKFKCATIAEAEMLAMSGAPDVLLAYQPVGPKAYRLAAIVKKFPSTSFSCLIDNLETATFLSDVFAQEASSIPVYIDLNVGMNRTGITADLALALFDQCRQLKGISIKGLHAYDGHIRDADFATRTKHCDEAFERVMHLKKEIKKNFNTELIIIAGGTPTYTIHCKRKEIECSPGTFIYWDKGYQDSLPEQGFVPAALVVTRIISKPTPDTICVDLGHKAIASENTLPQRVAFLNASGLRPVGHSEEHMVLKVEDGTTYRVGDILYGLPFHICPTVALYESASVVENDRLVENWKITSRKRMISV